jgi:hypothetical protein
MSYETFTKYILREIVWIDTIYNIYMYYVPRWFTLLRTRGMYNFMKNRLMCFSLGIIEVPISRVFKNTDTRVFNKMALKSV